MSTLRGAFRCQHVGHASAMQPASGPHAPQVFVRPRHIFAPRNPAPATHDQQVGSSPFPRQRAAARRPVGSEAVPRAICHRAARPARQLAGCAPPACSPAHSARACRPKGRLPAAPLHAGGLRGAHGAAAEPPARRTRRVAHPARLHRATGAHVMQSRSHTTCRASHEPNAAPSTVAANRKPAAQHRYHAASGRPSIRFMRQSVSSPV